MHAMGWLLLGSIPGVLIASQFTLRVPERVLRLLLASVLLLSGIKLLDFSGANWAIAAGAVVAVASFGAWALIGWLRAARPETAS